MADAHYGVLIVGGGSAGISIAARLAETSNPPTMAIVEPSEKHYYQPIWTLVGGGIFPRDVSEQDEADYIPTGTEWIKDRVRSFDPEGNSITTEGGQTLTYDDLVVAVGIQLNWSAIKGLEATLGKNGVSSNYSYATVEKTWEMIDAFDGGTALFTFPATPIKCAGAPQKIMYLAEEHFRRKGVRDRSKILYMSATPNMFGVAKYRVALDRIVAARGIEPHFKQNLVEVRAANKEAVFRDGDSNRETVTKYDFMHVTPPQGPPDVIRTSPLANDAGWVEIERPHASTRALPQRMVER